MLTAWESLFDGSLTLSDTQTETDALAELPARRGVLLFADAESRPIQLLQTANLRGISRSRLAEELDQAPRRKADLGAITQRVYYTCCDSDLERHFLYQRLTHAVFGKDWKQWLSLPRREYAAIDRSRAFPYFSITGTVKRTGQTELFGPFPTHRAASQFCDCINTAFELCRNPAFLESGKTQSCPYRQMQSCHGLCCQQHGPQAYAEQVDNAVRSAGGQIAEGVAEKERQMKHASAALNFEAAQRYKKQADRLRELIRPYFEWTGHLNALTILFIDNGPKLEMEGTRKKVPHFQIWRLDANRALPLGQFAKDDADALRLLLTATAAPPYPYALCQQEHLETIGYFLYRKSRPGLWYNAAYGMPEPKTILADIDATFQ